MRKIILVVMLLTFLPMGAHCAEKKKNTTSFVSLSDMTVKKYIELRSDGKSDELLNNYFAGIAEGIYYANSYSLSINKASSICVSKITPSMRSGIGTRYIFEKALESKGTKWIKENWDSTVASTLTSMFASMYPAPCKDISE